MNSTNEAPTPIPLLADGEEWYVINDLAGFPVAIRNAADEILCDFESDDVDYTDPQDVVYRANLMAAAPHLFAALKFCRSVIQAQGMFDLSERMADQYATQAIDKATGAS